jgi:hypothetical protein
MLGNLVSAMGLSSPLPLSSPTCIDIGTVVSGPCCRIIFQSVSRRRQSSGHSCSTCRSQSHPHVDVGNSSDPPLPRTGTSHGDRLAMSTQSMKTSPILFVPANNSRSRHGEGGSATPEDTDCEGLPGPAPRRRELPRLASSGDRQHAAARPGLAPSHGTDNHLLWTQNTPQLGSNHTSSANPPPSVAGFHAGSSPVSCVVHLHAGSHRPSPRRWPPPRGWPGKATSVPQLNEGGSRGLQPAPRRAVARHHRAAPPREIPPLNTV